MPLPGRRWRHIILTVRGSWLHGDPRGFRSRRKRIASSGDYKNPPPAGEHADLYQFHASRSQDPIVLSVPARAIVGQTLIDCFQQHGCRILTVAVSSVHAHVLVELPDDLPALRRLVGRAKEKSSRAANKLLPGFRWARGETYKPVDSMRHQLSVFRYILLRQGSDAWTWSFRDAAQTQSASTPTVSRTNSLTG